MSGQPLPGQPETSPPPRIGLGGLWFAAWLVTGAAYALSLLAALSIGLFLLPMPVLATILLTRRRRARGGLPGLISGLGVPLLYVAYTNRSGPGTICTTTAGGGQECVSASSPWPWLATGAALVLLGVAAFIAWRRYRPRQRANLRS